MKLKTKAFLVFVLCFIALLVVCVNFTNFQSERMLKPKPILVIRPTPAKAQKGADTGKKPQSLVNVASTAQRLINRKMKSLNFSTYHNERHRILVRSLLGDLKPLGELRESPWAVAARWVGHREVLPASVPELGTVMAAMRNTPLLKADVGFRGTQLKLQLLLEGGQHIVFKPKMYERNQVIQGSPYAGADRHNGEIAAFHLSRLLAIRRTPITVGTKVNLDKGILPVATQALAQTFFRRGNKTCFYGQCHYCSPKNAVCAEGSEMEGALILWLPRHYSLKQHRNPWQRTYRKGTLAAWEVDPEYCSKAQESILYGNSQRLLDLIDAAVFDYLIGNADRHHYETFAEYPRSMVLLLDNGKSFGDPHSDELTILAPLYQCCMIRSSTFERLKLFVDVLGGSLNELMSTDPLHPVLDPPHLDAMDRRLKTVIATVHICIDKRGISNVISSS